MSCTRLPQTRSFGNNIQSKIVTRERSSKPFFALLPLSKKRRGASKNAQVNSLRGGRPLRAWRCLFDPQAQGIFLAAIQLAYSETGAQVSPSPPIVT